MSLRKIPDIEIPSETPFLNDLLDLAKFAENLEQLISSSADPLVIGIDGDWGVGKTTFLKMFQRGLENHNFKTVYFNAWENDWGDDALIAMYAEYNRFLESIEANHGDIKDQLRKAGDAIKEALPSLLAGTLSIGLKVFTAGLFDAGAMGKAFGEVAPDLLKNFGEASINNYNKQKAGIQEIKKSMGEIQKVLSSLPDTKQPLIFIVDELDRCKPTYAVSLLERAKHIFNTPGIVFLLAYNRRQLNTSLKHLYGLETDSENYLKRFFDTEFPFPRSSAPEYANRFLEKSDAITGPGQQLWQYAKNELTSNIPMLNDFFCVPLRTQNQALQQLQALFSGPLFRKRIPVDVVYFFVVFRLISAENANEFLTRYTRPAEYHDYFAKRFKEAGILDTDSHEKIEFFGRLGAVMIHHFSNHPDAAPDFGHYTNRTVRASIANKWDLETAIANAFMAFRGNNMIEVIKNKINLL